MLFKRTHRWNSQNGEQFLKETLLMGLNIVLHKNEIITNLNLTNIVILS